MVLETIDRPLEIDSWNRDRSEDEIRSFIGGRLSRLALEEISIDDEV